MKDDEDAIDAFLRGFEAAATSAIIDAASNDHKQAVEEHLQRFVDRAKQLGIPRDVLRYHAAACCGNSSNGTQRGALQGCAATS